MTNAETVPQLVPTEFESGPSYVKHTISQRDKCYKDDFPKNFRRFFDDLEEFSETVLLWDIIEDTLKNPLIFPDLFDNFCNTTITQVTNYQ